MLLAIDTSTRGIGVALYDGAQVLSESLWQSANHHTTELAPAVAQIFTRFGLEKSGLAALGVAIGPGSFTGLRIGLGLAKGICFSRKIPLVGISTFDILAAAQPPSNRKLAAVIQAGRRRLAIGWYQYEPTGWQPTGELQNLTLDEFADQLESPVLICGELNQAARQRLGRKFKTVQLASPAMSARRPGVLAELAWNRWQANDVDDIATLKPVYLHHGEPIPG